jgi:hypothetical protein
MESGTITVSAESDWKNTSPEAEEECRERINEKIDSATSKLESEGKEVKQINNDSMDVEEREIGSRKKYKCSTKSEIEWETEE